jgi:multimeric flavodoxin WrbA
MEVLAINGSPRKEWNTATLLNKALEGADSQGAHTAMVHLHDLSFKGCSSCYECKLKAGPSFGRCAGKDDLRLLLSRIERAGALILGAPIYLGTVPGGMKSFLERLATPYLAYDAEGNVVSHFPRQIPSGFIHTMGGSEEYARATGVDRHIRGNEAMLKMVFGPAVQSLVVADTLHVDDYSKYLMPFDAEEKMKVRRESFPLSLEKAFEMGAGLANGCNGRRLA